MKTVRLALGLVITFAVGTCIPVFGVFASPSHGSRDFSEERYQLGNDTTMTAIQVETEQVCLELGDGNEIGSVIHEFSATTFGATYTFNAGNISSWYHGSIEVGVGTIISDTAGFETITWTPTPTNNRLKIFFSPDEPVCLFRFPSARLISVTPFKEMNYVPLVEGDN